MVISFCTLRLMTLTESEVQLDFHQLKLKEWKATMTASLAGGGIGLASGAFFARRPHSVHVTDRQ